MLSPPPGLATQDSSASGTSSTLAVAASALVRPKVTQSSNPLLAVSSQPAAKLNDPRPQTRDSLVASLFPTRRSAQDRAVSSGGALWSGLHSKAGAAFTDNLGGWPPEGQESASLATDRITHALDSLRKAQDEDRTGAKGTLTSI